MFDFLFRPFSRLNRRYAERKKTRNLILLSLPAETKLTNLIDLSESGAQIISSRRLRKNKVIELKINLAEQNREVLLKGKVMWSRMTADRSHLYRVGVHFVEISQEAWMKLHSYLSQGRAVDSSAA